MKIKRIDLRKLKKKRKEEKKTKAESLLSLAVRAETEPGRGPLSFAVGWGIGTLFLISLTGAAVSALSLAVVWPAAAVWSASATALCVALSSRPKTRLWLLVGAALFAAAAVLFGGDLFRDGLALTLNGVKDLFGMELSRVFLPTAVSGDYGAALCVTVFLLPVTLILAVVVAYVLRGKGYVTLSLLLLALFLLLVTAGKAVAWPWYGGLFAGLALLFLYRAMNGASRALPVAAAVICIVSLAAVSLPAVGVLSGSEPPKAFAAAERGFASLGDFIRWGRDHTNNLPEGNLKNLPAAERKDSAALDVTMSEWESLYLRGYVGSVCTGSRWEPAAKETLYGYKDLFYWLHDGGFYGTSQIAAAVDALGEETEPVSVTVKTRGAKKKYVYTPYEYASADIGNASSRIGDITPDRRDYDGAVTYSAYPNHVRTSVKLASELDAAARAGNEDVLAYLKAENGYRAYVYETCLDIPEKEEPLLRAHFGEVDLREGHIDYDVAMQNILDELWASARYDEEAEAASGVGFLRDFLEMSCTGYDVHYAAAAALAFRWYGIPARYVEGYIVTPEDLYGVGDGETVTLTGKNAHAWAEYYRDGVGWIPFEVTPPYVYVMEQPDQISTPESELADSESDRQGMVEMEEDNYEDIEEEEPEREPEAKLPGWVIAAMAVGSLLLLALAAFVILALRRRAILLARKRRIKKADDRESVDLIFRDILAILFASGIRRRNVSLERYVEPLKAEPEGRDIGSLLRMAIDLHREAVFSDHPVSESRRKVFAMLRREVVKYAKSKTDLRRRFVDQYIKCVY